MNKFNETSFSLFKAVKYSLQFCFRNAKKETIGRLIFSALVSLTAYFTVLYTGYVVNGVQKVLNSSAKEISFTDGMIKSGLIGLIAILIIFVIVNMAAGRLNWNYRFKWSQILRHSNNREIEEHKASLDIAMFVSKKYADLAKRIEELPSSWSTRTNFSESIFGLIGFIFTSVSFGVALIYYQPIYVLVIIVISIPLLISELGVASRWWKLFEDLVPHYKKRNVLEKAYKGPVAFMQAIMFNQMPTLRKEIDKNTDYTVKQYDDIRISTLKRELCLNNIILLFTYLIIAHAIWFTISTHGNIGTLTVIIAAIKTFQNTLENIIYMVSDQWNNARGVILIEEEFFNLSASIKTEYPVVPDFDTIPEIEFKNVSFAYPDTDKNVLEDINFKIKPGERLAIVGKSGNGKSTLLNLLMRYYDPTSGGIFASGVPLKNIEPKVWNNVISALTQEYVIMERTIGEEIASSRLGHEIDPVKLKEAIAFAEFDEVLKDNEKGIHAQIGTDFGGREFSGGEKQRLAIARFIYKNTPVIVLDEPDAKLDPFTAERLINNLFNIKDVTIILITHHVSRAERCDNILVMGKGRIVEQGSHVELVAKNGVYTDLYNKDKERLLGIVTSDSE